MRRLIALPLAAQRGTSLIEVLVTLVITAYGVLGLTGLMNGMHLLETEGYQRSQALVLLGDMVERITSANPQSPAAAAAFANSASVAAPVGTGDSLSPDCSGSAGAARDLCEWSNALKGAAEKIAGNRVGAMNGARGCIELLTPPDASDGICTPATFRVTVAWQGLLDSAAPASACGRDQYGADSLRRVLTEQVTVGLPACTVHD